jgi:pimeloyl-ACP methyl ester carboxylesterase
MSSRKRTIEVNAVGEPSATRVVSRDGTEIAYWTSGEGPPLVLVHGAPADHTRFRPLLPHLEPYATVHAMDRRGRGATPMRGPFHPESESGWTRWLQKATARRLPRWSSGSSW